MKTQNLDADFVATIYHNPNCGTSRNTLALIQHAGAMAHIVEYLSSPPTRAQLVKLIHDAGLSVRQALRPNVTPYTDLGLDDLTLSDDALLEAMLRAPLLINRPFVTTPLGTRLCRPSEIALEILPTIDQAFVKEDGSVVPANAAPSLV